MNICKKIKNKKGQVTIFVIIGIVILILIGVSLIVFSDKKKESIPDEIPSDPNTVQYFVQSCLETSVQRVTDKFGVMGFKGFPDFESSDRYEFVNPSDRIESDINYATYFFLNGQKHFPFLAESEMRYSQLVEREFENCVNDFEVFKEQGIKVEKGILTARTSFNKNDITATIDWPLTIIDGETVYERNKYFYKMEYSIKEKYDVVLEYISFQESNLDYFQIGKIVELSQTHDFEYEIHSLPDDSVLIMLIFNDYKKFKGEPFKVVFVVK